VTCALADTAIETPRFDRGSRLFGVLVTFGRPALLRRSLEAIRASVVHPVLLIVVDNAPEQATAQLVASFGESIEVEYVPASENLGPAGGRSLGFTLVGDRASDEDWIAFFDDDAPLPDPDFLGRMFRSACELHDRDRTLVGLGARGATFDRRRLRSKVASGHGVPGIVDSLPGASFPVYNAGALRRAGGFDRELFFGHEELELGLRLADFGYRLAVHPSLGDEAADGLPGPAHRPPRWSLDQPTWHRYYSLRNLIAILRRRGMVLGAARVAIVRGIAKPLANLPFRPGLALRHLRMNIRAIRDAYLGRLGPRVAPEPSRGGGRSTGGGVLR
jgi:glycosyltransferase involved in cell wall biosynthesis